MMMETALAEKPRWLAVLRASLIGAAAFGLLHAADVFAAKATNPDFTKGESIPEGFKHDWNLGATGARGWIFSGKLVTRDARQVKCEIQMGMGDPKKHPEFAGTVASVETRGFSRPVKESPSNFDYHWNHNGESHYLVGEAMGQAMVKLLNQK